MTKKQTEVIEAAAAVVDVAHNDALVQFAAAQMLDTIKQGQALAVAAPRPTVGRGKEEIDGEDTYLPRLTVAQSTSPQTKKRDASYIDGLEEGMLFNSLTGEIYPDGVTFAVVKMAKRAAIFDGAGKVVEHCDWDDPRVVYPEDAPEGFKPEGARIYDFFVVRVVDGEPVERLGLSFKKTAFKAGKRLKSLLHVAPGDSWDVLYTIKAVGASNADFNYFVPAVNPVLGVNRKSSAAVKAFAEAMYLAGTRMRVEDTTPESMPDSGERVPY
jgi:hypothetical protein